MKKFYTSIVLFLLFTSNLLSQEGTPIVFTSSDLPILIITTSGQSIVVEPKITAHMGIIDNGDGNRNNISDPFNGYDGYIGIEIRGYSSSGWSEKKPYGFETRNSIGENNNVSLLGLPVENDWVLHAPIADKSLMRNKLIYDLAREMGQYAPGTRFCELVINGDYRGVYVLVEKVKQDNDRVDLDEPDSLNSTGGYLVEFTPEGRVADDETSFMTEETETYIVVKYPDEDDITTSQVEYIKDYFNEFESALFGDNLADEVNGYSKYIDVPSFIDHILLSECFHQLDALRSSQFFYKKKDGKLFMGPIWDCNRSIGNVNYYHIYEYDMWWMLNSRGGERVPYVNQLMTDPVFVKQYTDRWFELRGGLLSNANIMARIDGYASELDEAKDRNFERWPDMLAHSYGQVYTFDSYEEAVDQVKDWITNKFAWLDAGFEDYDTDTKKSGSNFTSFAFEEQTGDFTVEFDWSPQNEDMNGVVALADTTSGIGEYTDLACMVRFYTNGQIDARNEGTYENDAVINYNVGEYYHVRMEVDVNSHTYDVFVTPRSTDVEVLVAQNYGFRSNQSGVQKLNGFVMISSSGSYKLRNFFLSENSTSSTFAMPQRILTDIGIKCYPNPFSESITISLEQVENSLVNINIYSIDGTLINQIHNGELSQGIHEFTLNGNNMRGKELSNGIYFCRYVSNGKSKSIKIVKTY